jgi:hypothetical protein
MYSDSSFQRACVLAIAVVLASAGSSLAEANDARRIDEKADAVLRAMSDYYTGLTSFSVDVATYRIVTKDRKSKDAIVLQTVAMRRPNGFSLVQTGADGDLTVKSNGSAVTTYLADIRQYIVTPAPKSFEHVAREPSQQPMRLALEQVSVLGALVLGDPYDWLMEDVASTEYVALEKLDGGSFHHVVLSHKDTDWNLWIASGSAPLLKMMVPDLSRAILAASKDSPELEGVKLDVTMLFENWVVNTKIPDSQFTFAPPSGARKVERFSLDGAPHAMLGRKVPPLKLALLGGGKMNLASHRGKRIVVLEFWASWSKACRRRLPLVAKIAARFADRGVVFYAVNQGEDEKTVREFLKKLGLDAKDITVVLDRESEVARRCGVTSVPQTIIIGRDGTVRAAYVGEPPERTDRPQTERAKELQEELEKELERELERLVAPKRASR